jgi:hypothetical protein
MLLETLPLPGQVDPGLRAPEVPLDLASIGKNARLLEEIGYHGMAVVGICQAIARKLGDRYGSVVTLRVFDSGKSTADEEVLRELARTIQAASTFR